MPHTPSSPLPVKKTLVVILIIAAAKDIKELLGAGQVKVSDDDLNRLVESLKGKDINKLIAEGVAKIGNSGPVASSGPAKPAAQ